ncbi:MAG TPA: hypothetical protein DEQ98_05735 [Acidobacteria bacterium]|nr:hypothetical protein [Acidobacteriota bacterium]HCE02725.1 hypothetical protein [Acidobacteriota bacterium]
MRAMTLERWNGRGTVAVGMLTLLFAVPGAAAGGTDAELQREVEQRFSKKEAVAARIDVVVRDDEVTLTGELATLWEKEWALDRARNTDGVAAVVNYLTVSTPETDPELAGAVSQAIGRYPYYTVFDHVTGTVENGIVTLTGDVTPYRDKPADIYERVAKVRGVQGIVNQIEVLSPGIGDARLRASLARRLFNHPSLNRYTGFNPGIHVIVKTGYVTLIGTVYDQADKLLADSVSRRTFGVIRVYNELKTRDELKKAAAPSAGAGVVN